MVLVDTSIWIDFFRSGNAELTNLLNQGHVYAHPFVLGELACGHLTPREDILKLLATLPTVSTATSEEVLQLIEDRKLFGLGLGYIDIHLLASALLSHTSLWTRDKKLAKAAEKLRLAF